MSKLDHLTFDPKIELSHLTSFILGECKSLIFVLKEAPLTPEARNKLRILTMKKGVLSTTAIEGNSVTEEEYDRIIS